MLSTKQLFEEAESLPVEQRAVLADSLLKTLNPTDSAIDRAWIGITKKRSMEIRTGKCRPVAGADVARKMQEQYRI